MIETARLAASGQGDLFDPENGIKRTYPELGISTCGQCVVRNAIRETDELGASRLGRTAMSDHSDGPGDLEFKMPEPLFMPARPYFYQAAPGLLCEIGGDTAIMNMGYGQELKVHGWGEPRAGTKWSDGYQLVGSVGVLREMPADPSCSLCGSPMIEVTSAESKVRLFQCPHCGPRSEFSVMPPVRLEDIEDQ